MQIRVSRAQLSCFTQHIVVQRDFPPRYSSWLVSQPRKECRVPAKELFTRIVEIQIKLIQRGSKLRIDTRRPLWVLVRDDFPDEYHDLIGGGCAAGFSGLALMPNEDVMPCRRMDVVIGNLERETFFDIWYGSDLLWKLRDRNVYGSCSDCIHVELCSGCKAIAYAVNRDLFGRDPLCWYQGNID